MNRFLAIEDEVYQWIKEIGWFVLVVSLVFRIVAETPVSVGFEEWARGVLYVIGILMIPGALMRLYLFFKRIGAKNRIL